MQVIKIMSTFKRFHVVPFLVVSMVFPTALTYAQATESTPTESVVATSSLQLPEEGTTIPEVEPIAPPAETVTQSSTSTDELLQGADNPQDVVDPGSVGTSTEVVVLDVQPPQPVDEIPTDNPTTTDEVLPDEIPPTDVPPAPPEVEQLPVVDPMPQEQPATVEASQPVAIALEEIAPDPEYVFSVNTGKHIPAKRRVKEEVRDRFNRVTTVEKEVIVDNAPQVTPDNREGTMQITSSCTNKYYVVLVYKNEGDYDRDRTSYIVNKAYPCQGGNFTYLLDDLPSTLQNGTYYVLIGEQGDTGGWLPISGLTEITINRN